VTVKRSLLLLLFLCSTGRAAPHHTPLDRKELPTTDASLFVPDLEERLRLAKELAKKQPGAPPIQLTGMLLAHAQYFGVLDEYDQALAAAEQLVKLGPKVPEAWLLRAGARAALHQFDGALADLDRAAALGSVGEELDASRAAIWQASGRLDEALTIRERLARSRPSLARLGAYAQLQAELGRVGEAERQFVEAQYHYDDVSPVPVAWLYFQNGLVEERAGRASAARELYQAAHDRLPQYAPATGHLAAALAAAGDRAGAIALLRPLVQVSDDPEYRAQLGVLLGDEEGAKLITSARVRYRALVKRHPEAFADHAARFWMGAGGDRALALALARRNLQARRTSDAAQLVIEAALALKREAEACSAAESALALPHVTAGLHYRAGEAFARCGRAERAQTEMKLAVTR